MESQEDRIRRRAYELWERAGQTGDPEDHWLEAERELSQSAQHSAATTEEAPPESAVQAAADVGVPRG